MPFGMVNSGSTYNWMIRKLLDGSTTWESYVDDILGYKGLERTYENFASFH